jgi:hypothetical protein
MRMHHRGLKIVAAISSSLIIIGLATTVNAATAYIAPNCTSRCIAIGYDNYQPDGGNATPGIMGMWTSQGAWATPLLGNYNSADPAVIDKHAEWLTDMGVDFIGVDWTNSAPNVVAGAIAVDQIEKANTDALFAEYQKLSQAGKPYPRIALIIGDQDEGNITQTQVQNSGVLDAEANYIYTHYVQPYPNIYYSLNGKPLIIVYTGIPQTAASTYDPVPSRWNDSNLGRFTLRNMTVYDIPHLYGNTLSSTPIWSWIDQTPWPSDTGNPPEEETVTQAYPGCPPWENYSIPCTAKTPDGAPIEAGRDGTTNNSALSMNTDNSVTFRNQWAQAIGNNPKIIFLTQWDEWDTTDVITPNFSNDLEPSQLMGCGPMIVVQQAVAAWKGITLPAINCNPPAGFVIKTVPKMTISAALPTISVGQTDTITATFTAGAGDAFVSGYGADLDELPPSGSWEAIASRQIAPFSPVTYAFTPTAAGTYQFAPYSYTNYYPGGGTIQPITVTVTPSTITFTQSLATTTETNNVGQPFHISWTSINATSCIVEQQTPSGTIVNPWATGTSGAGNPAPGAPGIDHYWIDCTGPNGTAHADLYHTVIANQTVPSPVVSPVSPTNLSATCTANTATHTWSAVSGATSYAFYEKDNVTGVSWTRTTSVASQTIPGLYGTSYSWSVAACNSVGCSAAVSGSTFSCAAPAKPTGSITSSAGTSISVGQSTTITLNATAAAGDTLQYLYINQSLNGAAQTNVIESSQGSTNDVYTFTPTTPGTYTFYGWAYSNATAPNWYPMPGVSVTITVTAPASPVPPPNPASITYACSTDGTQMTLSWPAVSGATLYYPDLYLPGGNSCPLGWNHNYTASNGTVGCLYSTGTANTSITAPYLVKNGTFDSASVYAGNAAGSNWNSVAVPGVNISCNAPAVVSPPTEMISADQTSLTIGQSTTIRATFTASAGDTLLDTDINEVPVTGGEFNAIMTGAIKGTAVQTSVNFTFTPTVAGSYVFKPFVSSTKYLPWATTPAAQWVTVNVSAAGSKTAAPVLAGYFDSISTSGTIGGWTLDKSAPSASIGFSVYVDGPIGSGTLIGSGTTNALRSDVNTSLGVTGNHGISWQIPSAYLTAAHSYYLYGTNGGSTLLLINSPRSFGSLAVSESASNPDVATDKLSELASILTALLSILKPLGVR